ncbi:MAG: hypothetical protein OXU20_34585 [Myxococcales bacterium]|nr:hypothetical protein [Myxococcales bacterium]
MPSLQMIVHRGGVANIITQGEPSLHSRNDFPEALVVQTNLLDPG